MRRKFIFFGIGILLLCLAGWGIYKVLKPHHNAASEQTQATISASELYNEFQKAENLANQKWVGKVIEVTGRIASVTDAGNYVSVNLLATGDGNINCSILKKDLSPDDKFSKGDSIVIKGKCAGFLMDVNLVDCIVKK
jgi:hypothetical protein